MSGNGTEAEVVELEERRLVRSTRRFAAYFLVGAAVLSLSGALEFAELAIRRAAELLTPEVSG